MTHAATPRLQAARLADTPEGGGSAPVTTDSARIISHFGIGVFETTPDGRYVQVNAGLARMLGYPSPEALLASPDAGRLHYADPAQRRELVRLLVRDGRVEGFLAEGRRRDGRRFWGQISAAVLRGADGRVDRLVGTVTDVTALAQAQEEARAVASDLRRFFDNAPEGIYRSSPEGRQLCANPALVRLNGYASEDEMLAAVNDIAAEWYVDSGRRAEFRRLLSRDGQVTSFESEIFRHKTRERIWVSENAWEVRDRTGALQFYEGTVVDITQRKRAEQALGHSEERFRDFAETASDWFWETGPDHRFTYMSDWIAIYGIAPGNDIGRTRFELAADTAEAPVKWQQHQHVVDHHQPFRDFVYRSRTIDGRALHIAASGKPLFDAGGRFLGYRGSARDVSAAIAAEGRLRRAISDAETASQAKGTFLANMSHELRTPLNAILGFAEIIRDQMFGANDPRYPGYARFICESGGYLLQLINDILDMAKIDAGRMDLHMVALDAGALIERQVALTAQRAAQRNVELVSALAPGLPRVMADELRLRQIVLNLLSNAVKFTNPGGRVAIGAALAADGRLAIAVTDTGIGMSAQEIELALQPFRQVDTHMDRRYEGTGLGLPITKSLVALHGGELHIESEKGKGTRVSVLLPCGE